MKASRALWFVLAGVILGALAPAETLPAIRLRNATQMVCASYGLEPVCAGVDTETGKPFGCTPAPAKASWSCKTAGDVGRWILENRE